MEAAGGGGAGRYLMAVLNWATRCVLSWRLSNTMETRFCLDALEDALGGGAPGIFNTDQGSQFTSLAFTERVLSSGARISMERRGRFMANIFIERLWRSLEDAQFLPSTYPINRDHLSGVSIRRLLRNQRPEELS